MYGKKVLAVQQMKFQDWQPRSFLRRLEDGERAFDSAQHNQHNHEVVDLGRDDIYYPVCRSKHETGWSIWTNPGRAGSVSRTLHHEHRIMPMLSFPFCTLQYHAFIPIYSFGFRCWDIAAAVRVRSPTAGERGSGMLKGLKSGSRFESCSNAPTDGTIEDGTCLF